MKNFGDLFGKYISDSKSIQDVTEGEVVTININKPNSKIDVTVAFPHFVERRIIFNAEKQLRESKLGVEIVNINPKFPSSEFKSEYCYDLLKRLSINNSSINGIIKNSSIVRKDNELTITLKNGGNNILSNKKIDRLLSNLIEEEFGINLKVVFNGILSVDEDSCSYINKEKIEEEKIKRENLIEEIEVYESSIKEKKHCNKNQTDNIVKSINIRIG